MKTKFAIVALLFLAGAIHAESRIVPTMRPTAEKEKAPAVKLPTPWPEIRKDAGNCPGGQCTGEACRCDGQGQACKACPARSQNATTVDLPGVVLAVGQCPGGQCPVPQRSAVMGYSYPTAPEIAPPVYTGNYLVTLNSSPQLVSNSYTLAADRPRLFGRLFTGKLFSGKCCGKCCGK